MAIWSSVRHSAGKRGWRAVLTCIAALSAIFFAGLGAAGQQTAPRKQSAHPASKAPSPFAEAQALLRQGKLEDARNKLQEELQQNPSRPEGYALLGLVYTAEKNYSRSSHRVPARIKTQPQIHRNSQRHGQPVRGSGESRSGRKRIPGGCAPESGGLRRQLQSGPRPSGEEAACGSHSLLAAHPSPDDSVAVEPDAGLS